MADNKMEQVAQMFGKKLGEDFTLRRMFGFDFEGHFSEDGFEYYSEDMDGRCCYKDDGHLLYELITGQATIIGYENQNQN